MKAAQFKIEIGGIGILVTRKKVKNVYLRVRQDSCEACLTAPFSLSVKQIETFVLSHIDWLAQTIEKMKADSPVLTETIPCVQKIWGEQHSVMLFSQADYFDIRATEGQLQAYSPSTLDFPQWEMLLNAFLRAEVSKQAPALIAEWCGKLELPLASFGVRHMKKRWGTCYPTKARIILNSELGKYPRACLEHVIVHELVHFYEPKHGAAFRALMDKMLPDWRRTAQLLGG